MSYRKTVFALHIALPVLIAALSFFVVADLASSAAFTAPLAAVIDESRQDALKLAGSSTAVSVAITALPSDLATPVADVFAKLIQGFMVVLCALYLEKLLLSLMGAVVFRFLVPLACAVYIAGFLTRRDVVKQYALKIACFGLLAFCIIPTGAMLSNLVEEQYGASMDATIQSAENCADQLEESVKDDGESEDAGNGLGKILESLQQAGDTIANGTSEFMRYLEKLVNRFLEAIALMLVTSCLIPILVVACFIWLGKAVFGAVFTGKTGPRAVGGRRGAEEAERDEKTRASD